MTWDFVSYHALVRVSAFQTTNGLIGIFPTTLLCTRPRLYPSIDMNGNSAPTEVTDRVIDFVEWASLFATSLVARQWRERSQYLIYRECCDTSQCQNDRRWIQPAYRGRRMRALLLHIFVNPRIATFIERMALDGSVVSAIDLIPHFTPRISHLTSLYLTSVPFGVLPISAWKPWLSVKELTVDTGYQFRRRDAPALWEFLLTFNNLVFLHVWIDSWDIDHGPWPVPGSRLSLPSAKTLKWTEGIPLSPLCLTAPALEELEIRVLNLELQAYFFDFVRHHETYLTALTFSLPITGTSYHTISFIPTLRKFTRQRRCLHLNL